MASELKVHVDDWNPEVLRASPQCPECGFPVFQVWQNWKPAVYRCRKCDVKWDTEGHAISGEGDLRDEISRNPERI